MASAGIKALLSVEDVPKQWYNILADLPEPLPPPLDPRTMQPAPPDPFFRLFGKELVLQEVSSERYVNIPEEVREAYIRIGRPTPLQRATRLEKALGTPAKIYYKREDLNPAGSHKPNTAIAQAYYNAKQGIERLTTETGAGQWGTALALSCALFDLELTVFMTRASYLQKPYRKILMETYGAEVHPSPSDITNAGRKFLEKDKNHPGSLGIGISEAIEACLQNEKYRYSLGSVLNHVLLHQTVVGLEAKKQMEMFEEYPDYVVGCIGGGSNYSGLAYPFMQDKLRNGKATQFVAAEPKAVPSTTRGVYTYDYGDTAMMTPLLKMYTVGHDFLCPPIHAGGLRYHGKAPSMCLLINKGYMQSVAYHQKEVLEAGRLFAKTEGLVAAPETCHAIKGVVDIALKCKQTRESKIILFNYSGHGLLDLKAYEDYMEGKMVDFEATNEMIKTSLATVPKAK